MLDSITQQQPAPTGEGRVVMEYVKEKLDVMALSAELPQALKPINSAASLRILCADLANRAEMGKAKYGTYLRTDNGRDATIDVYQELCDAIMYAAQARLEGRAKVTGNFVEVLICLAAQLAETIERQG